jgi:hypothetical protein
MRACVVPIRTIATSIVELWNCPFPNPLQLQRRKNLLLHLFAAIKFEPVKPNK